MSKYLFSSKNIKNGEFFILMLFKSYCNGLSHEEFDVSNLLPEQSEKKGEGILLDRAEISFKSTLNHPNCKLF
jgi:hypothetical protein